MRPSLPVATSSRPARSKARAQMYLSAGSKNVSGLARGVDRVHLAVGRGAGVDPAVGSDGERVHLELGRVVEERWPRPSCMRIDLAVVAGAGVERALAVRARHHTKGASVSCRTRVAGARRTRPSESTESPLGLALEEVRRALDACQNCGCAADAGEARPGRPASERAAQACPLGGRPLGRAHRSTVEGQQRDPVTT